MKDEKKKGSGYPVSNCPFCDSANLKKFDELRDGLGEENLSPEELADYKAGKWGTLICQGCGLSIDYQEE
jgi:transcription elongation factor Elf1